MRSSTATPIKATVATLAAAEKKSDLLLFIVIFVMVFFATPLLVLGGAAIGFQYLLGILAALAAAVLVVKWPITGLYVLTGCVALVEEEPLATHIFTDQLYIYYWPPRFTGLPERPIGFFLLFVLLVYIVHRLIHRQRILMGGPLLLPFLLFLLAVAIGVVHGLASGGKAQIIVLEVRPLWYLFIAYLIAYNFITQKRHVRAIIWMLIVAAGVKGAQGTYIFLILFHGSTTGHNEIMAHEESFFFVAMLLLLVLFVLHHPYRPQVIALLLILPVVVIALAGNQRRADYVALLVGIIVSWALIFLVKPQARKRLAIGMVICAVIGTAYALAFSHAGGSFAGPARAVMSVFVPSAADPRDAASNAYRVIENSDLIFTMKQSPVIGWGFGKPFLQPTLLPNIVTIDPYYNYVPHNTIYWIWMRLGAVGYFLLWYLLGVAIVRGCMIVRRLRDPYLQLIAIFVVAATVMEVIVAEADYQLFFYRNVFYLGLLLGLLMKLPTLDVDEEKEQGTDETAHDFRPAATPPMGCQRAQLSSPEGAGAGTYRLVADIRRQRGDGSV